MGFSVPALRYYPLNIYSLFPREGAIAGNSGTLDANSSFTIQQNQKTQFTPTYAVNQAPSTDRTNDTFFYRFSPGQGGRQANSLTQTSLASASNFTTPLAFSAGTPKTLGTGSAAGASIGTATIPAVAPQTPDAYLDRVKFQAISDLNMDALLALPEFRLRNVGVGLRVTTDGLGNVDNVVVDFSNQGVRGENSIFDPSFGLLNRSEILLRESLRGGAGGIAADNEQGLRVGKAADSPGATSLADLLAAPAIKQNSVIKRLLQLQPQQRGLGIAGFQAELNPLQSRQLAASQAGFDVLTGGQFKNNVLQLLQPQVHAGLDNSAFSNRLNQAPNPFQLAQMPDSRMLDGRIPMAPSLPAVSAQASSSLTASNPSPQALGGIEDAVNRKSSGAYLPFRLPQPPQSEDNSQSGFSPGAGGDNRDQRQGFEFGSQARGNSGNNGGNNGQQDLFRQRRMPSFMA